MRRAARAWCRIAIGFGAGLLVSLHAQQEPSLQNRENDVRFRSGIELINVSATVSDDAGRFVRGLRKEDFVVYEDDRPQIVTHFSAERVPVSLGVVLDTSGSMVGERIRAAQHALDRFLGGLLDPEDEIFLYRFSDRPVLVQSWTTNREQLRHALGRILPDGTTAMYDAVAAAVRLVETGQNLKRALLLLSDGNDTASMATRRDVKRRIVGSDTLVYAIGLECGTDSNRRSSRRPQYQRRGPIPIPLPFPPGGRRGWPRPPQPPPNPPPSKGRVWSSQCGDPVDRGALRDMTDDSGGRTEIVHGSVDLDEATAGIADELSQQYYLGYISDGKKDGRWHSIRVEVRNKHHRIRARRGYLAS